MTIDEIYEHYKQYPNIQTDTRKLQKGDFFFALKGPRFNGNKYVQQALDAGASLAIADEEPTIKDSRIIVVDNVLQTLQRLANFHRRKFTIPFIAITGSNGKTTTKELVHTVLSQKYKTYTTEGNLNNHIGIPLTILKIKPDAEMAVIEMGANHQHEIEKYCMFAEPTHGLITNIGKAHLEGFGDLDGVKKGKGELFTYLGKTNGTAFVYKNDPMVLQLSERVPNTVMYGTDSASASVTVTSSDPYINIELQGTNPLSIETNLVGQYNLPNILAAVTVGRFFEVADKKIQAAIQSYSPSNSRSQLIEKGTNTIILDAYNANPGSMKSAIDNFAAMKGDNKVLFLGDMKELGHESQKEHQAIADLLAQYAWKEVILVGPNFSEVKSSFHYFDDAETAAKWLAQMQIENSMILIKGSRSMQMEKILEYQA